MINRKLIKRKENEKRKRKNAKKIILHNTGMVTRKEIKHMRMPMRISITYASVYDASTYDASAYDVSAYDASAWTRWRRWTTRMTTTDKEEKEEEDVNNNNNREEE